jgi:hypothetical protein
MLRSIPVLPRLALLGALCSCDGPWNMSPPDTSSPTSLQVSLTLVSGRRFDTLRVQAPLPLDGSALPSGWMDVARSSAVLRREGATDSVVYRPLATDPTLWAPVAGDSLVRPGTVWNLALDVSWNDGSGARLDTVRGTARIPSGCGIGGTLRVPAPLRDSLLASDPRSGRGALEASALDSLRRGLLPWRNLSDGDTLWFPHSTEPFVDPRGASVPLAFQKLSFALRRDASLWGGVWAEMEFTASARRVVSLRARREEGDDAEDPEELQVVGTRKVLEYEEAGEIDWDPDWPERWGLEADLFDRTGPVVLRVYFPEPGLLEWRRGFRSSSRANGLLRPKLTGAQGFVAGACVDSLPFTVRATRDTL